MRDRSVAGFKYFDIASLGSIRLDMGGACDGKIEAAASADFSRIIAQAPVKSDGRRLSVSAPCQAEMGVQPLFFRFTGEGALDFYSFTLVP